MFFYDCFVKKNRTVCFLGETTKKSGEKIYSVADELIKNSFNCFVFSADSFFCLDCARQIILRKKKQCGNFCEKIKLTGVIPFEEHIKHRSEKYRDMYFEVMENCDEIILFDKKYSFVSADFAEFILDKSCVLICPEYGAEYEKLYATAKGIKIIGI